MFTLTEIPNEKYTYCTFLQSPIVLSLLAHSIIIIIIADSTFSAVTAINKTISIPVIPAHTRSSIDS